MIKLAKCAFIVVLLSSLALLGSLHARAAAPAATPTTEPVAEIGLRTVRVAAIGIINDQDFWKQLSERFQQSTHIKMETVDTGSKDAAAERFRHGGIDLIAMQSNDDVLGLVADGWAMDAQPWAQMDLILVGPDNDPAGVKDAPDLVAALRKIAATKSPLLIHDNSGAREVILTATQANGIELPPESALSVLDNHQRRVITVAAERKAYTLVARLPFVSGKLLHAGLSVMVQGDPRLLRPYLFAIVNPARMAGAHTEEARQLAVFLRSPETQNWIANFGRGSVDARPLFLPVDVGPASTSMNAPATTQSTSSLQIEIEGLISTPQTIDVAKLAAMPRQTVSVKDHDGKDAVYSGVRLRDVLIAAGVPIGNNQMRGPNVALYLVAVGADGYKAVIALPEVDAEFGERSILVADTRDGRPLDAKEGAIRLVLPQDARQARWVRQLTTLRIARAS